MLHSRELIIIPFDIAQIHGKHFSMMLLLYLSVFLTAIRYSPAHPPSFTLPLSSLNQWNPVSISTDICIPRAYMHYTTVGARLQRNAYINCANQIRVYRYVKNLVVYAYNIFIHRDNASS